MTMSDSDWQIWELHGDLLENEPRDSVDSIFDSDAVIDKRTKQECQAEFELLFDLFEFLTGLIRGYYLGKDGWKENIALRVALALVNQCWNYHSAVLKLISSGYFGESHALRRSWFERVTLAYLLFGTQDRELANRWLDGKRPSQKTVNESIRDGMPDEESRTAIYESLKGKREYLNDHSHPDSNSLLWRHLRTDPEKFKTDQRAALAEHVGEEPLLGGIAAAHSQKASLLQLADDMKFTCSVLLITASNRATLSPIIQELESRQAELFASLDIRA